MYVNKIQSIRIGLDCVCIEYIHNTYLLLTITYTNTYQYLLAVKHSEYMQIRFKYMLSTYWIHCNTYWHQWLIFQLWVCDWTLRSIHTNTDNTYQYWQYIPICTIHTIHTNTYQYVSVHTILSGTNSLGLNSLGLNPKIWP